MPCFVCLHDIFFYQNKFFHWIFFLVHFLVVDLLNLWTNLHWFVNHLNAVTSRKRGNHEKVWTLTTCLQRGDCSITNNIGYVGFELLLLSVFLLPFDHFITDKREVIMPLDLVSTPGKPFNRLIYLDMAIKAFQTSPKAKKKGLLKHVSTWHMVMAYVFLYLKNQTIVISFFIVFIS